MSSGTLGGMILASASPRRKRLMIEAGLKFTQVTADMDESVYSTSGAKPVEYAKRLALAKAFDVAAKRRWDIVIGADTIVDFEGEIIGKAVDAEEAARITKKLFSKAHKVITAVAIVRLGDGLEMCESDVTVVYPKELSDEQIACHIASGLWEGKAGAYGIGENGDEFVERIEGSLTNVMGIPMELFGRMLEKVRQSWPGYNF